MLQRLRRIALFNQGLNKASQFGRGLKATQQALETLGYIQIDTISVIERAHHHTLWNRVPDYKPEYLQQLIAERKAFEYWFHAASYLPMRDYRFALPKMTSIKRGDTPYFSAITTKTLRHVMDRIKSEGPLKARDFETDTKRKGQWWDWKPSKRALEKLFMQGDLMITARNGMEKIYDLTERVLPADINTTEPGLAEFAAHLVDSALQAHGFTSLKQLMHVRTGAKLRAALNHVLQQYESEGVVKKLELDGLPVLYVKSDMLDTKISMSAANVRLLSPFDNAIIHRDRVLQLFDFDYRLECYVPKDKRQYGYFCLPILYKDKLVGQVDCKVHRKIQKLDLLQLHINKDLDDPEKIAIKFAKTVQRFMLFNRCQSVVLLKVRPHTQAALYRRHLGALC